MLWYRPLPVFLVLLSFFLSIHFISLLYSFHQLRFLNGLSALLFVVWLSGYLAQAHDLKSDRTHYSHCSGIIAFQGEVVSGPLEKEKYFVFDVQVSQVLADSGQEMATGLVRIFLRKPAKEVPEYGDVVRVSSPPREISSPMNPGEFDFRVFMLRKGIHSQAFVDTESIALISVNQSFSIKALSISIREQVQQQLIAYFPDIKERQIAMALLIGLKEYLDAPLKDAYAAAGATHILAVSGLHVGILYLFVSLFTKPMRRIRFGVLFFVTTNLMAIWLYALVTGMSPSVFRAAIMFSVLILADSVGRNRNTFNSLGIAAFILLLINPYYAFEVGFQLSFLAVLGIVYLFPLLYQKFFFSNTILDKLWSLTCVSIAAQISTAPLSIFYFHQFPTYFLLTNLIVIPASFVILMVGIPMILLGSIWSIVGQTIGFFLGLWISLLNYLIEQVQYLPWSKIDWIYLEPLEVLALYGFLFLTVWSFQYRRITSLSVAGILVIVLLLSFTWRLHKTFTTHELIIYETSKTSAIDLITGGKSVLIVDKKPEDLKALAFRINPYRLKTGLNPLENDLLQQAQVMDCFQFYCLMQLDDFRLTKLNHDFLEFEIKSTVETDVLIVSNDALDPTQLKDFQYSHLVFDSSNSTRYLNRVKKKIIEIDPGAHFVTFDGAWQLNLPIQSNKKPSDAT